MNFGTCCVAVLVMVLFVVPWIGEYRIFIQFIQKGEKSYGRLMSGWGLSDLHFCLDL